jgi:uncharacterized Zn-binding protein involved in type VI secretion
MAGKYVLDGAKLQCPLCSKKEGKLKVTSNKVKLQDKPAATEGDNGKLNLQFQGNCTHPQFSGGPPPPCKSVISVVRWQNTSETKFDGQKALVEGSTIMCQTGGVPITIKDTTQKATPTNLQGMYDAGAPVPGPSSQKTK